MDSTASATLASRESAHAREDRDSRGEPPPSSQPMPPRGAVERAPLRETGRVHCLLTDDDPALLDLLKTWLAAYDVEVSTARTGAEAQRAIAAGTVHLLVTDLVMEGMDGIELLRRIGRAGSRPRVLGITGVPGGEALGQAFTAMGAEAFLMKPFSREQFLDAAQRALGRPLRRR